MTLFLVTPATEFPVTVDEALVQCFATGTTDFNVLLSGYIAAATDAAERYLSKALTVQTWTLTLSRWDDVIELPFGPIAPAPVVKYFDTAGVEQTLSGSVYEVDANAAPPLLVRADGYDWPDLRTRINPISITFTTEAAPTPPSVKQAILMLVAFWFSNRESVNIGNIVNEVPMAWKHLLDPYSRVVI